ncbi:multifunctional methyltransferase subunit TRM112-like protein [Thrips palmi]|uniref:Multifunctional methyltransferase subunit TRM112-like protein n=1 Tax=Thrips palmi TaxID=161013 RepID=A0A6P9ABP4_THRPL|nr:multifunctional methyltransferase subunit TRM112-like protein [Thrips palmi]
MKLLTHNVLSSKCLKGVSVGYPLRLNATDIKVVDVDFNSEFVSRMIPKINYSALYEAAQSIGHHNGLPDAVADDYEHNDDFLKAVHHVLLEVDVVSGDLECPESGRKFPITRGIPNMLVNENEVNEINSSNGC